MTAGLGQRRPVRKIDRFLYRQLLIGARPLCQFLNSLMGALDAAIPGLGASI
jgi:hypothetical protein